MPKPGNTITYNGQDYVCVEVTPYQNQFGRDAPYSVWQATCAEPGCTRTFRQSFPPNFPAKAVVLNRRCSEHAKPGVPVPGTRQGRGRSPVTYMAANWLVQFRAGVGRPLTTTEFAEGAASCYDAMSPELAAKLGALALSEAARRQYVLRGLKLAAGMGRLKSRRVAYDLLWDFTERSAPK
jgi:hypothetical protein